MTAGLGRWVPWLDARLARPPAQGRWVVVDVETSGLNALEDELIAIGALAVSDGQVDLVYDKMFGAQQYNLGSAASIVMLLLVSIVIVPYLWRQMKEL